MLPGTTVYISRAIPRFGLERSPFDIPWTTPNAKRRPSSLRRYRNYVLAQPELIRLLPDLRGKTLVCWCRRSDEERTDANTCHGDILLDILDFHTDEDFEALATRIEKEITAAQSLTNVPGSNSAISEVITIQGRRYVALLKRETGGWQFTLHARDLFLNFDDGLDALHWINHALRDESNGTFGSSLDQ